MTTKTVYSIVAVAGIAAASGTAWWYQSRETGPREIASSSGSAGASSSAPVAAASQGSGGRPGAGLAGVEVAKAEATRLQDDAQAVGSLRSRQNVMLRPEVSGRIQSLGFTDGARVRRGETLVQLEDTLQRAEVRQAEAQVSLARANLKRNQELVAQNFVAQRVVDESGAQLQVQEAQLSLACARWERMRVVAPFDGTVGIRSVNLGDYVKDGADLVNIEDLSSMFVDFRLPERFIGKIRREQPVELQLDAMPGRQFKAKIEAIDPQVDANGRAVNVRAVLSNTAGEPLTQRGGLAAPGAGGRPPGSGAGAGVRPNASGLSAARPVQRSLPASVAPIAANAAPARPVDVIAASCAVFSRAGRGMAAPAVGSSAPRSGVQPGSGKPGGTTGAVGGGGPLRPGMFARVTAIFNVKDQAVTVPEEALVPQGGRQFVFKLVEQSEEQGRAMADAQAAQAAAAAASAPSPAGGVVSGAASVGAGAGQPYAMAGFVDGKRLVSQRVEVKTGIRRPGRVEITEGLMEGDTVVIAGQQRLQRDHTPVRVVELGRPAAAPSAILGASTPASAASR